MIGKCHDCRKRRKLWTINFDPDIPIENRCKSCLDKWKMNLMIRLSDLNLIK